MNNNNRYIIIILCFFQLEMAHSESYQHMQERIGQEQVQGRAWEEGTYREPQQSNSIDNWFADQMGKAVVQSIKNVNQQNNNKPITVQQPTNTKYKQVKGVTKCDLLAAHPFDQNKKAPGVSLENINTKEAIKSCNSSIKKSPKNGRFYYQLGRALEKDGQITSALTAYQKALDHSYVQANYNLGIIMADLKQYKSAINHFEILAKAGHEESMFDLSVLLFNLGDKPRSDFWLRKAGEKNQPDAIRILREEQVNAILKFF